MVATRAWRVAIPALLLVASASASPSGDLPAGVPTDPQRFTDPLGHEVSWIHPPQRIVSLSPSVTEILFAIGHDTTTVVGRTRFCNFPPAAGAVPIVGGVVDFSVEQILLREPDLVLATRGNPVEAMESLMRLGMPLYAIETRGGLERIFATIEEVGAVAGRAAAARALAAQLRVRVAAVEECSAGLPIEQRPVVFYGELEGAHWTAGPGSYLDGLIRAAGGRNVGQVAPSAWSALSTEVIVAADPQVYLGSFGEEGRDSARERALRILATAPHWQTTRLHRDPRIFLVHEDRLQRPGPRVIDVLEEFARFLHPDSGEAVR